MKTEAYLFKQIHLQHWYWRCRWVVILISQVLCRTIKIITTFKSIAERPPFQWILSCPIYLKLQPSCQCFVVIQSPSHVRPFATPWTAQCQASLSLTISQSFSIASVMPSSHLILWCPLLLLTSIFPSIRDFSNESAGRIRWPKYWSFSFSISPLNNYSGLISLKIDWFYLLAVQGTLKSLLQHYSSKASILCHSAFFLVQLSQLYMTTGKTIALIIWTFVGKVISLLFNTLSRFVIGFLPKANIFWFHGCSHHPQWF